MKSNDCVPIVLSRTGSNPISYTTTRSKVSLSYRANHQEKRNTFPLVPLLNELKRTFPKPSFLSAYFKKSKKQIFSGNQRLHNISVMTV